MSDTKPPPSDSSALESLPGPNEPRPQSWLTTTLNGNIDTASWQCTASMVYACFLTGFTCAVSFTACYVWCGFQTGNVAQLGLAVARNYAPGNLRTYVFEKADQQALTSLLSFLVGTSLGRYGDKLGNKSRKWLIFATFVQALTLMAAALCAHFCGQSSFADTRTNTTWTNGTGMAALGFASASLGIQGIIGKRLNTQFATAVVLTTTWCELINDPKLFTVGQSTARDHKVMAVFFLFLGAMISRTLIDVIDSPAVLGIGAGLRIIQMVAWLAVP